MQWEREREMCVCCLFCFYKTPLCGCARVCMWSVRWVVVVCRPLSCDATNWENSGINSAAQKLLLTWPKCETWKPLQISWCPPPRLTECVCVDNHAKSMLSFYNVIYNYIICIMIIVISPLHFVAHVAVLCGRSFYPTPLIYFLCYYWGLCCSLDEHCWAYTFDTIVKICIGKIRIFMFVCMSLSLSFSLSLSVNLSVYLSVFNGCDIGRCKVFFCIFIVSYGFIIIVAFLGFEAYH